MASKKHHLYEKLHLNVEDSVIVVAPHDSEEVLVIDRLTFKIQIQGQNPVAVESTPRSQEIYGCLGMINLFSGPHLIVISQREEVGLIGGVPIYEVTKASVIQVARSSNSLSEDEKKEEKDYISLLNDFLEACRFYYSYQYDITHTSQRISQMSLEDKAKPLWERVDERFFWNKHIQSAFIKAKLDRFILPVVDGFIKMVGQTTHEIDWKYIFISRRGCLRTGARYHTRGADPWGNVANFVETEQIVEYRNIISAYVQVRGSIPFFWQQKGKGLKPKPVVDISSSAELAFRRHMEGLIKEYGPVVVVSLIDQRGIEVPVGESFETHMFLLNNPQLKYVAFDFHEKCKNNKYENLSLLLDQVGGDLTTGSYFLRDEHGNPVLKQTNIVRTNCIDCLDRTNVVQSVFAQQVLLTQLNHLGILGSTEKLEKHPTVENMFKHVWADNADIMSEQYTGTVALKTDFTRTGKRSVKGSVMDGVNSAKRYINKNFRDDEKQEAIDLFLGNFVVEKFKDSIVEGTYRFVGASMVNQWNEKGMDCIIQVDLNHHVITWYLKELGQRTDIPFYNLIQIEKGWRDYKLLRLHHRQSPVPVRFQFPTASIREQFTQLLYYSHPSLNPTSGIPRTPGKPFLNLKIFIGTWNMYSVEPSPEDLAAWIPKGKDLYALGTQHEEHKVPSPFSMPCKEYWHLMIRQYLGTEYIALATTNTKETSLIVLVRQSMAAMVNNLEVTPVKLTQKTIEKAEEKKGGLAKLKEAREKLKDQMKTNKEKNNVFGAGVLFRFVDTSFCMINYSADNGSGILPITENEESIMQFKGNYDLHNDFHHVFWFGNLAKTDNSQNKWVTLYSHEENGGGSSVLWRALNDAPMLSEIEVGCTPAKNSSTPSIAVSAANVFGLSPASPSSLSSSPSSAQRRTSNIKFAGRPNPPAYTFAAVGIYLPPLPLHPLLSRNHYCTIDLKGLSCSQMSPDLYLVCRAPFLVFPGRTGYLKKADDGVWMDDISVRSFIIDKQYIDMLYLHIELWDHVVIGEDEKLGSGVISLRSTGDIQPLPFTSSLWNSNEFVGEVSGEVYVTFLDSSAPELDTISQDPNHPFTPPMSIPNFEKSSSSESPPASPPKSLIDLSFSFSPGSSAPSSSSAPSTSTTSPFGGGFFTKLPFPQIPALGTRDARYSFFGGKPSQMSSHRDTPPESKDPASLSSSSEIGVEDLEISQPITSPNSRQPTPTRQHQSTSSSPIDLSSPVPHPEEPPKLPPKPAKFAKPETTSTTAFSPISPSLDAPLRSDPTAPLAPTPASPRGPSTNSSASSSPTPNADGSSIINSITRFGMAFIGRKGSSDQLLPNPSSTNTSTSTSNTTTSSSPVASSAFSSPLSSRREKSFSPQPPQEEQESSKLQEEPQETESQQEKQPKLQEQESHKLQEPQQNIPSPPPQHFSSDNNENEEESLL